MGALRLHLPTRYTDVVPRLGRAILFKSDAVEHEIRPIRGYDNYALTVWFNQVVSKQTPALIPIPDDYKVFVGIVSYRDSELIGTLTDLFNNAHDTSKLRIVVYH